LSNDMAPSARDILYLEVIYDEGAAVIFLGGEFDLSGAARFWAGISEALATKPPSLTVEARGLIFIDVSGLRALVRAREAADEAGVTFRVREPSPALRRIVEVAGTQGWCSPSDPGPTGPDQ
jgi:anti-sigma B factor antagonist